MRAGPGHADGHHGRHRPRRPERHPDQGRRGAGDGAPADDRRARQDGHHHRGQAGGHGRDRRRRVRRATSCCGWRRRPSAAREHPLATAIVRAAEERGLPLAAAASGSSRRRARHRGRRRGPDASWSATRQALARAGSSSTASTRPPRTSSRATGKTPMFVAVGRPVRRDRSPSPTGQRRGPATAIARLQPLGLEVVMLTGDNGADRGGHRPRGRDRPRARRSAAGGQGGTRSSSCRPRGKWSPWSATASTTPRHWRRPTSASPWGPAPTWPSKSADITLVRGDLNGVVDRASSCRGRPCGRSGRTCSSRSSTTCSASRWRRACFYPLTGWLLSPILASAAMALSSVSVVTNALRLRGFRVRA